jgi:hypothetical protein
MSFHANIEVKPARKRNFLTVGGDFGKIIDVVGRKLSFLRAYPGNVRLRISEYGGEK